MLFTEVFIIQKCIKVFTVSNMDNNNKNSNNNWAPIIIDNNWAANLNIRIISEGPCETEDWSNGR